MSSIPLMDNIHLSLPINGLLTQEDATSLEVELSRLDGVSFAHVDFMTEMTDLEYDADRLDLIDVEITINQCGFCLPINEVIFEITPGTFPSETRSLEQRLEKLPGVLLASVNSREGCARVQYIDRVLTAEQIRQELL